MPTVEFLLDGESAIVDVNAGDTFTDSTPNFDVVSARVDGAFAQTGDPTQKSSAATIRRILARLSLSGIPAGAVIDSATIKMVQWNSGGWGNDKRWIKFGLLRVGDPTIPRGMDPAYFPNSPGTQDPSGPWAVHAPAADFQFANYVREPNAQHRAPDGTTIVDSPSVQSFGGLVEGKLQDGIGLTSIGNSIKSATNHTLGEIRLRCVRGSATTGRVALAVDEDLVIELYNPINGDVDPRADTSVAPFATSDPVSFNSLPGFFFLPNSNPNNWEVFTFTGGVAITSGQRYCWRIVSSGKTVLPYVASTTGVDGSWFTCTSDDGGTWSGPTPVSSQSASGDNFGLWWSAGAFMNAYWYDWSTPSPRIDMGDAIIPGVLFQDELVPGLTPSESGVLTEPTWLVGEEGWFGDPLPTGGDKNFDVPGLAQLIQDWIDTADTGDGDPYEVSGQPTCIVVEPVDGVPYVGVDERFAQLAIRQGDPDFPGETGLKLEITYTDPPPDAPRKPCVLPGREVGADPAAREGILLAGRDSTSPAGRGAAALAGRAGTTPARREGTAPAARLDTDLERREGTAPAARPGTTPADRAGTSPPAREGTDVPEDEDCEPA